MLDSEIEELIHVTIGAMIDVHKELGPGFLENIYHKAMEIELANKSIQFESEKEI